jgi:hypothetical protein
MTIIRAIRNVCFLVFVMIAPALGQTQEQPAPAATGSTYSASLGYTSVTMAFPGAGHVRLNGMYVSGSVDLGPRWGATLDLNYARAPHVFDTPHPAYLLSSLLGPVFYPSERRNMRVFLHALAGVGDVDGALPRNNAVYHHGYVVRPSYDFGGGLDHSLPGPFTLRIAADYLRTSFINNASTVQPQNNLRLSVGFVFPSRKKGAGSAR